MKKNISLIIWSIFALIGTILFLIGLIVFGNNLKNEDKKVYTNGVIADIVVERDSIDNERTYDVYVEYSVQGTEYESILNGYSSNFYEGKEIEIYYYKDNPGKIGMKIFDNMILILPGIASIFMVIGLIGIIFIVMKSKKKKRLKETGKVIYADYLETQINYAYVVNGRNPYNIICEWNNPEDGKKYLFKSDNIWTDPEEIIMEKNITTFPVYINENKIKEYVIDTQEIENSIVDLR